MKDRNDKTKYYSIKRHTKRLERTMFDLDSLFERAGVARLTQAQKLLKKGAVQQISLESKKQNHNVCAQVIGTEVYQVSLSQDSKGYLYNECSCPAATYQDVCKHCTALALAVVTYQQKGEPIPTIAQEKEQLRAHLLRLSHDELVNTLVEQIHGDIRLWDKWQTKISLLQELNYYQKEAKPSLAEVKKRITKALPKKSIWDWHQVRDYFDDALLKFENIKLLSQLLTLDDQWKLWIVAIERLNLILEQIDDSSGDRFELETLIKQTITQLFIQLDWTDQGKAEWLVKQLDENTLDIFPDIPEHFELTPEVNRMFLHYCEQALAPANNKVKQMDEERYRLEQLKTPLLKHARESKNWKEECRLLALGAYQYDDFLEISQVCLDNAEMLDAEHWLIKAKKVAKKGYEVSQCTQLEITLCLAQGEEAKAWRISWRNFVHSPSYRAYKALNDFRKELAASHTPNQEAFNQDVEKALLDARETASDFVDINNEILSFYLYQNALEKAENWAKNCRPSQNNLMIMAQKLWQSDTVKATELYLKVLNAIIYLAHNKAYQEAIELLLEIEQQTKEEGNAEQMLALNGLITQLASKHKAKRNMIKRLKENFAPSFE